MKKLVYTENLNSFYNENIILSPSRKERCNILTEKEKKRFISAENFTHLALKDFFSLSNPVISGEAGEKAKIQNSNISISRSYADSFLVLAMDSCSSIGSDVERIMEVQDDVMNYFFTKEERDYVNSFENRNIPFTLIWTRKESYIKCLGEGLKYPFNCLNMTPASSDCTGGLFTRSYQFNNYIISVTSSDNENAGELRKYEVKS